MQVKFALLRKENDVTEPVRKDDIKKKLGEI